MTHFSNNIAEPNGAGRLKLSEIFDSIQGEGASAGARCTFLRLALCNLRCSWCDTKYTWDFEQFDYAKEVSALAVSDVRDQLRKRHLERLVITGGEPLLQQDALAALLRGIDTNLPIEVETNGTLVPEPYLAQRINQWNVSPKLGNSNEPLARRFRKEALSALCDTGRAWLKLVVATAQDMVEVETLLTELEWPRERTLLMPQAANRDELGRREPLVQQLAAASGLGVSRRLHIECWDGQRGR